MTHGLLAWLGLDPASETGQAVGAALRVVLILGLSWALLHYLERLLRRLRERMPWRARDAESERRAETLLRAVRYGVSGVVLVVAALFILGEFGVSIAPLLATAGVAGVALGFGAQ